MNLFQILVTCIVTFSLLTFIVLFGHIPSLRRTPVGWSHHLLMVLLPRFLGTLDRSLTNGSLSRFLSRKQDQLMNERHPSVLVMYLVLFGGGVWIFLTRVMNRISPVHRIIVPPLVALPLLTLWLAASTDPGYVTAQTHAGYMEKYQFDGVLFRRGHECVTCKREKPARSKHCSLCGHCIAKHDHHCIWINSCVGEKNMKWFLAFLVTNLVTFGYATLTLLSIFLSARREYPSALDPSDTQTREQPLSGVQLWLHLLRQDVWVGALFLFVGLCTFLVFSFLVYHSYLVFSGVTTNETLKFEDVRLAIKEGDVALYSTRDGRYYIDLPGQEGEVDWSQLENLYDVGWRRHLMDVIQGN